jgi:hypothetical protein
MMKNAPLFSLKKCFNLCAGSRATTNNGSFKDYETAPYMITTTKGNILQTPTKGGEQQRKLKKHTAKSQLTERFEAKPICNSTQLDEAESSNISRLPFLQLTPELRRREKLSSTVIQQNTLLYLDEQTQVSPTLSLIQEMDVNESLIDYEDENVNAFNNELYCSPADIPQMPSHGFNWSSSGLKNLSSEFQTLSNASPIDSIQFQTVNPSFFKDSQSSQSEELHVCVIAYQAKDNSEVDLVFADRVQIIYEKEEQYLDRKSTRLNSSHQCGKYTSRMPSSA